MNIVKIYNEVGSNSELKTVDTPKDWIRAARYFDAQPAILKSERILTADILSSPSIIAKAVRESRRELEISLNLLNIYNRNYCSTIGDVKLIDNNIEYRFFGHYPCYPTYSDFEEVIGYRFFSVDNFNVGYIPAVFFKQQYWDKLLGSDYNVSFVSSFFPGRCLPNQRISWTNSVHRNLLLTPFVTRDFQPIYELDPIKFRFCSDADWQSGYFYVQDGRWALITSSKIYFLEPNDYIDILQLDHSTQQ